MSLKKRICKPREDTKQNLRKKATRQAPRAIQKRAAVIKRQMRSGH